MSLLRVPLVAACSCALHLFVGCAEDQLHRVQPKAPQAEPPSEEQEAPTDEQDPATDEQESPNDEQDPPNDEQEPATDDEEPPACQTTTLPGAPVDAGGSTTWRFSGVAPGATSDGSFVVDGGLSQVVSGTLPTSGAGAYAITLPLFCGEQVVRFSWVVGGCALTQEFSVTTTCVAPDISVALTWDELGRDWELHLLKPGGRINDNASDCTWTSCIRTSPDWGVVGDESDNPHKDIDDVDGYGPENITLAGPEAGLYWILVEHWSGGGDPGSDGTAQVTVGGVTTVIDITDLPPFSVRYVATVSWPSGVVTPHDDVFDCTANWHGGCREVLPLQ